MIFQMSVLDTWRVLTATMAFIMPFDGAPSPGAPAKYSALLRKVGPIVVMIL
jgi:hypothetical protein